MKVAGVVLKLVFFGMVAFCACENSSDSENLEETEDDFPPDMNDVVLNGRCMFEERLGGFEVNVVENYSSVNGKINDAVVPSTVPAVDNEEDGCLFLRGQNPECDPPCESGNICNFDGICIPYPSPLDVGVVQIDGLSEIAVLKPVPPGNSYFLSDLSHPAFYPGDPIRLTTTDGYFGVLTLWGIGVEPLIDPVPSWVVEAGEPLIVTWKPPGKETRSRISLYLNIDQHGASPVTLKCNYPDTGQAKISVKMIDAVLKAGVSGFPSGRLIRETVDFVRVDQGCIDFSVTSPMTVKVEVKNKTQ